MHCNKHFMHKWNIGYRFAVEVSHQTRGKRFSVKTFTCRDGGGKKARKRDRDYNTKGTLLVLRYSSFVLYNLYLVSVHFHLFPTCKRFFTENLFMSSIHCSCKGGGRETPLRGEFKAIYIYWTSRNCRTTITITAQWLSYVKPILKKKLKYSYLFDDSRLPYNDCNCRTPLSLYMYNYLATSLNVASFVQVETN